MNTCKQCRWWGTESPFAGDDEQPFECLNPELRAVAVCESRDGFGKVSNIATFADFGCNQYENLEGV